MRRLTFSFRLKLNFSQPVQGHHYTLRALPSDAPHQKVLSAALRIAPESEAQTAADRHGRLDFGCVQAAHDSFEVLAEGSVLSSLDEGEHAAPPWQLGPERMLTHLTRPGPCICALERELPADAEAEALSVQIMELMHARFAYVPGSTGAHTTGEEAAQAMRGVCQDESHIMLALLRMRHIPCRYVVGYMLGEGSTHAWVEVLCGGRWIGLDPTNHRRVDDTYIRVSVGRDADDCPINRGLFLGGAAQTSESSVRVWEVPETAQEECEIGRT